MPEHTTQTGAAEGAPTDDLRTATASADNRDRPDRRPPRGNQEVETIDVERGQDKIERVLGW